MNGSQQVQELSADRLRWLAAQIRQKGQSGEEAIRPRPVGLAPLPLSFPQESLWFLDQLEGARATYNIPEAVRLTGRLDVEALRRTLGAIVRRHEALRTTFGEEKGVPFQVVSPAADPALPLTDLTALGEEAREAELRHVVRAEAGRPFDLERGPMVRASLFRLAAEDHLLLLTLHHIAADGWSMGVLVREIAAFYGTFRDGGAAPLPALPIQYADYAIWQRERFRGERLAAEAAWWRERLAGLPESLDLPTDRPRPRVQSFRGGRVPLRIDPALGLALADLAAQQGATLFMVLLAGFQAVLARYSGQTDFAVGSPIANRNRPELEGLIGFFVNPLALRADAAGDPPFAGFLAGVRRTTLEAYEHQELPFEKVVEEVQPGRELGRSPLFQVMLVLQSAPLGPLALPGLELASFPVDSGTAKLDLTMAFAGEGSGLGGSIEYSADLFEEATVARLAGHLATLLAGAAAAPATPLPALPLLTPAECRQILDDWSLVAPAPVRNTEGGLHRLFEIQAARTPDAQALVAGTERLTYRELDARSSRLARRLRDLGVGPESLVAVLLERSADLVAALLAVLKAGGAYVPLDPAYPDERIAFVLEDTRTGVVLTRESLAGRVADVRSRPGHVLTLGPADFAGGEAEPGIALDSDHPAYVIYTSGSTGRPKGVVIRHGSAAARIAWAGRAFRGEDLAGVLASTSVCFDLSVFELFAPLACGGRVILAANALELPFLPTAGEVTLVNTVPSALAELVRAGQIPASVRTVCLAGEPLPRPLADAIHSLDTVRGLFNLYGPSEDTTYSTWGRVEPDLERAPSIGRPLPGTRVHLLDRALAPVPAGVPGELYLGGSGLARGYLHRPELTAERFVPDPFSGREPGQRLYRTGDLARWRPDGEIEFLGRIDHQVKVRGFRIEPGEIEAALLRAGAREAAVVAVSEAGDRHLVAYVSGERTPDALRDLLRETLPAPMIPSLFVALEALPRTPNGKVDRKALPAPERERTAARAGFVPPRTPDEELLAAIWAGVLDVDPIGVEDNFFALGGHSLLATRVASRVRETFGVELPVRALFERPTVAALAAGIEAGRRLGSAVPAPPLRPQPRAGDPSLSFAQERLWFLEQLEPGRPDYNMPIALELRGDLRTDLLAATLDEVVARHEALRTTFVPGPSGPVQRIASRGSWPLSLVDLGGLSEECHDAELRRLAVEEELRPFDLESGPLVRGVLVRLGRGRHAALLTLHHIVCDGWSLGLLVREVGALYPAFAAGRHAPLAPLPVQYADFATWQRSWLHGDVLAAELAFWREALAGAPEALELPADRPRPAAPSGRGGTRTVRLSAELASGLAALGRREGLTLFMTLLAAWNALLFRMSEQTDLVVGTPIANRNRVEIEGLIGFFANTLALRTRLTAGESFLDLARSVRESALQAYAHQDLPFERLIEELAPERSLARTPLFQVLCALQNLPLGGLALPGLATRLLESAGRTAKFDLSLFLAETEGGLLASLESSLDLFDRTTSERILERLLSLLGEAVADPERSLGELPLLSAVERHQVLREWNDVPVRGGSTCVHRLFAEQARRTPDAPAVVTASGEDLSYGEVDRRSDRLARRLRELGVRPDDRVGVCLERSWEGVVALLAILKAGGCSLPLDPAYPRERLGFMLADAAAPVIVTRDHLAAALPPHEARVLSLDEGWPEGPAGEVFPEVGPDHLSYVIYTSGSTGRPKGVALPHRTLANLIGWQIGASAAPAGRTLQFASPSFDVSQQEVFATWAAGGALVLLSEEERGDTGALLRRLCAARVERLFLPFVALQQLAEAAAFEPDELPPLREVVTAGEQLQVTPEVRAFFSRLPGCVLRNQYGPSETHVVTEGSLWSGQSGEVEAWPALPPIGRPVSDTEIHLLDPRGVPVPAGAPGEIYLAGAGLARGYLGRPDLTAERFVPDPWGRGSRLYRTGDLARRRTSGEIEFIGRIDQQVKIRGFRVELGEIEAALSTHPAVREVVVAVRGAGAGKRLVAYVLPAGGEQDPAEALRAHLRERLPDYMVPGVFVLLERLPLTPSGKVDRRALPEPELESAGESRGFASPVEELLAGIWSQVLGRQIPDVGSHFFELGGHSLLATQVVSRVRDLFHVDLPVRDLFAHPTLGDLARRIEAVRACDGLDIPSIHPRDREREIPLSFNQERIWFLEQLHPGSPAYFLPSALELTGRLRPELLAASLREVVDRHEALRTTFALSGSRSVQRVARYVEVPLPLVDLSGLPPAIAAAEADRVGAQEVRHPFDLGRGPLLRARLLRLREESHLLLLTLHHLVADGWSFGPLVGELTGVYGALVEGRRPVLPPLPVQYPDFACWQRDWLSGEVLDRQLRYWKQQLAGAPPVLELPSDRPRPAVPSQRGAVHRFALPGELAERLCDLGRQRGTTLFMTLTAGFSALLARLSGHPDLTLGTPIANRRSSAVEELIGLFMNTLALRIDTTGAAGFAGLLDRVREVTLGAYDHQDLPFERLVDEVVEQRSLEHSPVFQVLIAFQNTPRVALELPEVRVVAREPEAATAKFDLSLYLYESRGGFEAALEHSLDLFDPPTVSRMAGYLRNLLTAAVEEPGLPLSRLPLLSASERHQLLGELNDTEAPVPPFPSIPACFDEQAGRTPEAEAVLCGGAVLTYRELQRDADLLALRLRALGVGPDHRVGLLLHRSENLAVALLGVLKAGGSYVPLDPSYPDDRLAFMAEDAGLTLLLTEENLAGRLPSIPPDRIVRLDAAWASPAQAAGRVASDGIAPANLAYVIYTSGSTGRPKGVLVTHGAVLNFFAAMDAVLGQPSPATWLAVTSISFDISVLEVLWTLCRGFRVAMHEGQVPAARPQARPMGFGLFYFSSSSQGEGERERYRLLLEGARFADRHGFTAVWTPERHFHAFGGLYPNPAVLGAALAVATERIEIRAGSVVLPLQNPLRVAEEWSVVDNLSGGRVGVSFASGWHADDFVLAPERYQDRKAILFRDLELVRRLWRRETVTLANGAGRPVEVAIQPPPRQSELPFWITAGGSPETFRLAGESGGFLLTHLLGQTVEELTQKIALYREARRRAGHQGPGQVTLMVHTFVDGDPDRVREKVWKPFRDYLATSVDLLANLGRSLGLDTRSAGFTQADMDALLDHACERYFHEAALFGTPESCRASVRRFQEAGVDELACLIDFGIPAEDVLGALEKLDELRCSLAGEPEPILEPATVPDLVHRHGATFLQCTPSMARMLVSTPDGREALGALHTLLVGGEALPENLAEQLLDVVPGRVLNMYGPTETTVWSACHEVRGAGPVPIGRPVANTGAYLLDTDLEPVPPGVPGEVFLGGLGVTRGYHRRPELTAERFVPDAFSGRPGGRLYRTGDRARTRPDGSLEFLGRVDHQVKIRGYRIEPGEIDAALAAHPAVSQAVTVARPDERGERQLAAYVVPASVPVPALEPRRAPEEVLAGRSSYRWPNGMVIAHLSDAQASQLYDEIFRDHRYLRHGIELRDGDCVFDVGANIGSFTLFANTRSRGLKLYSFEPIPPTFGALKANVDLYGLDAKVFNYGLSDRAETADFTFYPERAGLSGRYADPRVDRGIARSIIRSGLNGTTVSSGDIEQWLDAEYHSEVHRCELRTLSSVIAEHGVERIDLLKVDVERAELDVLAGLGEEDWPKIRQVALEVDGRDHLAAVTAILESRGFQVAVDDLVVVEGRDGDEGVAVFMVYGRREGLGSSGAPVPAGEAELAAALRAHLRESLPDYMVPAAFVVLDRLPTTPNGKIDRGALPAPGGRSTRTREAYRAPESETEKVVAEIWRDLLSVDRVGLGDNFFELGGNSLMVVQVRSALQERLGIQVPLVDLFRHPTVALLAGSLERSGGESPSLASVRDRTERQKAARDRRRPVQKVKERA